MPLPDIKDIYRPILEALRDEDPHNLAINDLMDIAAEHFDLGELSKVDRNIFKQRINQAKKELQLKNFMTNPTDNMYIITAAGLKYLDNPDEAEKEAEPPAIIPEVSEPEVNEVHEEIPQVTESESVQEVHEETQEPEELANESSDETENTEEIQELEESPDETDEEDETDETEEFEEIAEVPELDELPDIPDEPEMIEEVPQEVQEVQEEPDDIELEDEPESIIEESDSQEEPQEPEQYEMPSDEVSENEDITASIEPELEPEPEIETENEPVQIEMPSDGTSEDENITASTESELEPELEAETEQFETPSDDVSENENITAASEPDTETLSEPEPEEKYELESQEINENDVNDMNNTNEENSTGIEDAIRVHNEELAEKVLSHMSELPAEMFEVLVIDLLSKMGYRAFQNARYTSDEAGSDLIHGVIIDGKTASAIYIHARKSSPDKTIGRADMQDFIDALSDKGGKGIFATTANFSEQAEVLANDERIMLIDGLKLAGLMIAHNFCVKVEKVYEIKEFDTESFSDYQR